MKVTIYSVFDDKAKHFQGLVCFPNDDLAKRAFGLAVNSGENGSLLAMFPEDSKIMKVGEFDDESGLIVPKLEKFCTGLDLKISKGEK